MKGSETKVAISFHGDHQHDSSMSETQLGREVHSIRHDFLGPVTKQTINF